MLCAPLVNIFCRRVLQSVPNGDGNNAIAVFRSPLTDLCAEKPDDTPFVIGTVRRRFATQTRVVRATEVYCSVGRTELLNVPWVLERVCARQFFSIFSYFEVHEHGICKVQSPSFCNAYRGRYSQLYSIE